LHLLALCVLADTALEWPARLAIAAAVLGSLAWQCRAWHRSRRSGGSTLAYRQGQWWLESAAGECSVTPCADSTLLPFLIVLRLRHSGRVHTLLVPSDSLDREQFRRLRVLLRLRGTR
jgi:hypothetical protein